MSSQNTNAQLGRAATHTELGWALNLSTNVLILGAGESDIAAVQASIAEPVTVIADGPVHDVAGTCVIADALRLTHDQQDAVRRRFDEGPAVRVTTLSAVPLYPLVESGQFDETLYYRVNTITVDWIAE